MSSAHLLTSTLTAQLSLLVLSTLETCQCSNKKRKPTNMSPTLINLNTQNLECYHILPSEQPMLSTLTAYQAITSGLLLTTEQL